MTNQEWTKLIAQEFHVSNSVAKSMLSAMMTTKRIKTFNILEANSDRRKKETSDQ